MKKLSILFLLALSIISHGSITIVIPDRASALEKKAAHELAVHLKMATGKKFPVVNESTSKNAPAIYVGKTDFSLKNKISSSTAQGWIIRNADKNLVISGGDDQGIIFGVYEFLDRLGFRWLDEKNTIIPKLKNFTITRINITGKPYFRLRL